LCGVGAGGGFAVGVSNQTGIAEGIEVFVGSSAEGVRFAGDVSTTVVGEGLDEIALGIFELQ
jgi:hypothetical protein